MKKKLTKLEQTGLIAIVLAAGSFFYFTKFYDPKEKEYAELQKEYDGIHSKLQNLGQSPKTDRLRATVEKESKKVEALKKQVMDVSRKSSDRATAQQIISRIGQIATRNGLSLERQVFIGTQDGAESLGQLPWFKHEVTLRGGYGGVPEFVEELREADWVVALEGLKLAPSIETGLVELQLEILL
jgi:Tfp pilus assembly protein PilO